MNPLTWVGWKRRAPTPDSDPLVNFGADTGWNLRKEVESVLNSIATRHGAAKTHRLRHAVWALESALFSVAADRQDAEDDVLDRFFAGYWPAVHREVRADLAVHSELLNSFDEAVAHLVERIQREALRAEPDQTGQMLGRIAQGWYEATGLNVSPVGWVPLGVEYSNKLLAINRFLQHIRAATPPPRA